MLSKKEMTLGEAIRARRSIRSYLETPIEADALEALRAELSACNREGELNLELVTEEPEAFQGLLAHYGKFHNVRNYFVLAGKKSADLDERLGYYGERLVLLAQQWGLTTCWVGASFRRGKAKAALASGASLRAVISLGYGAEPGRLHKNKPIEQLYKAAGEVPAWFRAGLEAALLAPTARNQQSFLFTLLPEGSVKAEETGGFFAKMDLGIVKYHFEIGAGSEKVRWAKG